MRLMSKRLLKQKKNHLEWKIQVFEDSIKNDRKEMERLKEKMWTLESDIFSMGKQLDEYRNQLNELREVN